MQNNKSYANPSLMLLCLDLEAGSEILAAYAAYRARSCGDSIHVLHVERPGADEAVHERINSRLETLISGEMGDVTPDETEISPGIPEDIIVARAAECGAALIVLGRRARSTVERIYVGSTTSAVISLAPCPVLVVPLGRDYEPRLRECK